MSTEVAVRQERSLVIPTTGEQISLDAGTDDLAKHLDEIGAMIRELRSVDREIKREVLTRMDKRGKWTHRAGGVTVRGDSPAPKDEFDGAALRSDLLELVDEGELDIEAVDAAVEQEIVWKVKKAGVNALVAIGGRVREIVDRHRQAVEKDRQVRVSRG